MLTQRERTARVLQLLEESVQAHARGDADGFRRAVDAACEIDAAVVAVIRGGILIGEIPNPDRDPAAWAEYVAAAQEVDE